MSTFYDILYGEIHLPDWMDDFIFSPEMLRLRKVGLSNVDPIAHKDFSGAARWEHSIAVAYLCSIACEEKGIALDDRPNLLLAALYHDVATPPFAHSAEYVLDGFTHESEGRHLFMGTSNETYHDSFPIFQGELPKFHKIVQSLRGTLKIDSDKVIALINGEDDLGWMISGTIDLDNIDNVVRSSTYMGLLPSRDLPLNLVKWLSLRSVIPILSEIQLPKSVNDWIALKNKMYDCYFYSDLRDIGRESLVHHIIRSISHKVSVRRIIWNTEQGLLNLLASDEKSEEINNLIKHYGIIGYNQIVAMVDIEDKDLVPLISRSSVVSWIGSIFSTKNMECYAIVKKNKGTIQFPDKIFQEPYAKLFVFKKNIGIKKSALPEWLQDIIQPGISMDNVIELISQRTKQYVTNWMESRPWETELKSKPSFNPLRSLMAVEKWEFSQTRNSSLHSYPGTFVYAIPSNLIAALGLQGERILDPFSGTGQTASEGIKFGCKVYSADSNSIAILIQKGLFTYIDNSARDRVRAITFDMLKSVKYNSVPKIPDHERWYHSDTLKELNKIFTFVSNQKSLQEYNFLLATFSSILTVCTSRAGEQHGYFADNTPLPKGILAPEYKPAINLFLNKINKNLNVIESFYGKIIKYPNQKIKDELTRVSIIQENFANPSAFDSLIENESIAGIITSPPYICMADYTLGQRLSYYWIYPDRLEAERNIEIGARRSRFSPKKCNQNVCRKHEDICSQIACSASQERLCSNGNWSACIKQNCR